MLSFGSPYNALDSMIHPGSILTVGQLVDMRRVARWLVRIVVICAIVVAAALALQIGVLPAIVRGAVIERLSDMGLSEADLEVRSCSWSHAELANVNLDKEQSVCLDALAVKYSARSLLRGRLEVVEVTGAQLLLRIRDGQVGLGPLGRLKLEEGNGTGEPPFERIEVRSSAMLVE